VAGSLLYKKFFLVIWAAGFFCGPFSLAQSASLFDNSYDWQDPLKQATSPKAVPFWLTMAASSLIVYPSDETLRDRHKNYQQMSKDTERIGDLLGTGLPGLLIVGLQSHYDIDEARPHLAAITYTAGATYLFKTLFARERPGGNRSNQSFPSGHTSTVFATATSLTMSYGWKAAVVAYPLAAFTGLSRMASDSHFASDVVAGALLGSSVAYWSFKQRETSVKQSALQWHKRLFLAYDFSEEQVLAQWTF
jgi:membrane-associated phospholipid phosphatase